MSNIRTIDIGGGRWVLAIVFLEDGRHLLSGGFGGIIRQWRIEDGSQVGNGLRASSDVRALALSRDRRWIVSGENGVATVWDRNTRQMARRVSGHRSWVDTVDVSPDSSKFATGSRDNNVFIWNISTGKQLLGPLSHDDRLAAVRFSPDGQRIATATWGRPSLRICNAETGEVFRTIALTSFTTTPIHWTDDSQSIFTISHTSIRRIDVNSSTQGPPTPTNISSTYYASITLSSNGIFLASFADRSISLWDAATRARIGPIIEHGARLWSIALSLDNNYLATGDENGIITLRNLSDVIPRSYLAGNSVIQRLQNLLLNSGHTPDGLYRLKSSISDRYIAYQDGSATAVMQQLDTSSISQRWTISHLNDGTYSIVGSNGNSLSVDNGSHLILAAGRIRTTWTIEPRGDTYVIGNAANAVAISFAQQNGRVSVSSRNNNRNQRWVLERVTN